MMTTIRFCATVTALALASALAACGGSHGSILPASAVSQSAVADAGVDTGGLAPDAKKAKITIAPKSLALLGTGTSGVGAITVSEKNYKGKFKAKSTCGSIAKLAPATGKGPTFKAKVTPLKAGSCAITFTDTNKASAKLPITVTTAAFTLGASSISPNSASVKIVLASVNGAAPKAGIVTTSIVNLASCQTGCTVAGPQSPAGSDAYSLTIYDAASAGGNILATGTTSATVKAGTANAIAAAQLSKVPKFLVFGAIPSGSAGTAFTHLLTLAVQDADHAAIAGTYSTPVTVADSDTSAIAQGSSLSVNGGADSRSVTLSTSTDSLTLAYGGLSIAPVTLTASASGASNGSGQFAPAGASIVYSGPLNGSAAEIDLYNTGAGLPGNSGAFTLTQAGWAVSGFTNSFTYVLGGTANNCSSYSVSPASGTAAAYTVSTGASPSAGNCTLTLTGAPGTATLSVLLTYTSSSVGINGKHKKP